MGNFFVNPKFFASPGFIGFWVLFVGLIFTSMMFYFVFFRLNNDMDSYKDEQRKINAIKLQKERISRLYPKKIID
tara:strand:- start:902 stop:1126 length:225 start_codon:yes stop_codon:yes gene_type:complete